MLLQFNIFLCVITYVSNTPSHAIPEYVHDVCKDSKDIKAYFDYVTGSGYKVVIHRFLPAITSIRVKLDSGGTIFFGERSLEVNDTAMFTTEKDVINNVFNFILLKDTTRFQFVVKGRYKPGHPPYILSLKINREENCKEPIRGFFGEYYDEIGMYPYWPAAPDNFCGRRRINREYTELIVTGSASKIGDWPWHSAIYRLRRGTLNYICGGTLISKLSILTAAHCVTVNGAAVNPDSLGVVLGKDKLLGTDGTMQDKDVHEVIVHDEFERKMLNNDIAILKLGSEAIYNNYVQPACLWLDAAYDQMDSYQIEGTVVGWGIDQNETLSNKLREASMPLVPDSVCIKRDPIFYINILNGNKFCAGYSNGTAACNGDSGGGLMVFVQDLKNPNNPYISYSSDEKPGAWYVRGIVSVSLARKDSSICDPKSYTVFTDVAKYRDWILERM